MIYLAETIPWLFHDLHIVNIETIRHFIQVAQSLQF